jgi:hypothetical protein
MTEDQIPLVRQPGVVARRVAGEMLLIPVNARTLDEAHRTAELFVLNTTGERLWELLREPVTVEAMARNLMMAFEVSESVAREDVATFVRVLREVGMIVPTTGGP